MKLKKIDMHVDLWGGLLRWLAKGCRTSFLKETSSDNYYQNLLWALGSSIILIILIKLFW